MNVTEWSRADWDRWHQWQQRRGDLAPATWASVACRVAFVAGLNVEDEVADSIYPEVGGLTIRVSDHARLSEHHAAWGTDYEEADGQVLILSAEDAARYARIQADSPRTVAPALVVIRTKGERVAKTAKALRRAIARIVWDKRAVAFEL